MKKSPFQFVITSLLYYEIFNTIVTDFKFCPFYSSCLVTFFNSLEYYVNKGRFV